MGGFAAVLSGVIDLFSIVACVLPLVAFGVTMDWSRVFDCFGGITIAADMVASYLKTGMLLFVLGVNHETFVFIFDAVLCNFMELCLLGSSLFFYWSHKSYHGHDVAVARYSLVLLFLFMTGIATAIFGMKLNWLFSDKHIWWYLVGTMFFLGFQLLVPVIVRLIHGNMINDEPLIFTFKMVATALSVITAAYDSWTIGMHHIITDKNRKKVLLIVYIFCAVSSFVQGVVRLYGPDRIARRFKALCGRE